MEEKYYKCYNAEAKMEFNPADKIKDNVKRTDDIIKNIVKLRNGVAPEYVEALIKRLLVEVNDYNIDTKSFSLKSIEKDLTHLKHGELLTNLVIRFMAKNLAIPKGSIIKSKKAEFTTLNRAKAMEGLSYFRVKAFEDVLGKEEGIKLYSKILGLIVKEMKKTQKTNEKDTVKSRNERAAKRWCEEGVGDFTFILYDENKVIYRFDRCVTHEALKHHNDPDIAYIASCYIGDIDEWNEDEYIYLRRTQTLHHADFCDELYWDTRVHNNPEQPTLDFTSNIGRKK
ncbi:MAG: hypothetical protein E3J70_00385 [Candidatus Heimdallarchaeota archaeon]|nr:MAG: hypothetical protein E3J70_00385 [Candidatus Heimdallarchaeota archaeon]